MTLTIFKKTLSFGKRIAEHDEKTYQSAKSKGRAIGRTNPPKTGVNIFKLPFIISIINGCWEVFNELFGFVETTIQEEKTRYEQIIKEYMDNNILNELHKEKKRLLKLMKKALKAVTKFIKKQVEDAEAEIEELKGKIKNWEHELDELTYTKVFWPILISILLIVGILASEAFVNQKAFLFMKGENFMTSLTIALGISFCTFLLGLGASRTIQKTALDIQQKCLYVGGITLVALGVYYGVAVLRVSMMESIESANGRPGVSMSKATLMLINTGFFVSLVLVKIYIFPKPQVFKDNAKIKALKKLIAQALKKIQKLQNEIKNAHIRERAEKEKVRTQYAKKMKAIDDELKAKREALKKHQVEYNKAVSIGLNVRDQLLAIAEKAIGIYVEEINAFRNDGVILELPTEAVVFGNNPLDDYDYMDDTDIERLFNNNTNISIDAIDIETKNNNQNNLDNENLDL